MVTPGVDELIRVAIRERRLVSFRLHGLNRVAEVQLYGRHRGVWQLLVYQVGGESKSGGLPYWRRVDVAEISGLEVLEATFPGGRLPGPHPPGWDEILARVD